MDINQAANSFYTIEKMAPIAKSCRGKFSTNLSLKASLDQNMTPIEETIRGKGRVKTKSVSVEKFEPLNKLASELGIEKLAKQRFENLDISYKMDNGKIIVDPFVVNLEGVPATISGSMTLLKQELDYGLKMDLPVAKLPGNIGSQTAGVLGQLNEKFGTNISTATTIPVSLKIGGTIDKPTISGNYGELVKEQSKELKDQVKEEVKEIITEKVDQAKVEAIAKAKELAAKIIQTAQAQSDKLVSEATKQAEDLRAKGYAEAKKVEDSAKNVLEKAAKRALADKARKETDKQADGIIAKANEQAAAIMSKAQSDSDALIQKAENQ
jgi:vacuolar-type H+-ATPase subunit H